MGGVLAALATLAKPILARVIMALGFSVVTLTGADAVIGLIRSHLISNLAAGSTAALQIAGLAGVWVALGAVLGSVSFTLAMFTMTKAVKIASGG